MAERQCQRENLTLGISLDYDQARAFRTWVNIRKAFKHWKNLKAWKSMASLHVFVPYLSNIGFETLISQNQDMLLF